MSEVQTQESREAQNWALKAVFRPDLQSVLSRMTLQQLAIFKGLAERIEVDEDLTLRVAPEELRAEIARGIEESKEQIASALDLIKAELLKRQ